ncbi:MAG TPA: hypothetical protein VFU80_05855, partial [Sphingomicrobium sp.]|nr:hypothetical protein [Sphingomicrobium sp.]
RSEQALRESDRGIVQPPDSPAGLGLARTLRPELDKIDLRLTGADQILPWLDGAISARLFETSTRAGLGLGAEGQPLRQAIRRKGGTLNLQLNAELDGWLVALSGQYSHERRSVLTDAASNALATAGRSRTAATTRIVDLDVDASRSVVELPAGPLNLSLRGRLSRESVAGQQLRFVQWIREVGLGLELPIASAAAGVLAPLGELSAGLELTRSQVSRLGAMSSATWSAQWQPADWLRIAGSVTAGQSPVGVDLLAAPVIETPGVRYTDPLTGETTDVTQVSGGNPGLRSQRTTARSLSVALRPIPSHPLLISMDYSATRSRNLVAALPSGSELLLLAFPDRFFRGPDGSLVRVDVRPVNFDSRSEDLLRTSVDLSLPLSGSGARIQFNLAHSWLLRSRLKLSDDQPETDLLSPTAIALGDVPRPRHQIDASLVFADRGLGISLYAQHRSASFLSIGTSASPNILRFAPLTRIDVRLFVTGKRLTSLPLLEGMRFTLGVTNLFNSRERVRDLSGQTPLAYQPAYRDSTGRTVLLEIRKVF